MSFRPRRKFRHEVTLTPLIDVVFLLLIFFMVSTTFDRPYGIAVQLPGSETADRANLPKVIRITIDANGHAHLMDEEQELDSIAALQEALQRVRQQADYDADTPVVIRADRNSPHGALIRVMDALRKTGLRRINLATDAP
jgi:biopolymer transport protein ExbD